MRPALSSLALADAPERWRALGFQVGEHGECVLGGVTVRLGGAGAGITGWGLSGVASSAIDGLPACPTAPAPPEALAHPNGASGLDHVVVVTPDFDRTAAALDAAGLPLRRVTELRGARAGFRRLGPVILELIERRDGPSGPARFWGLVVVVTDLEALAQRLGGLLGDVRDAVQPGRRIATLSRDAGLSAPVAFMTPE